MTNGDTRRSKLTRLVQDAVARGQGALDAGDRIEAKRWLDRAHRLVPADGTVTLFLASALIGDDNPRAAALFAEVLGSYDVREGWLGLTSTRLLMGDLAGARAALAEVLSRYAVWPDIVELADRVAPRNDTAGWCGLTGEGKLVVHRGGPGRIDIRVDGKRPAPGGSADVILPPSWPRARSISVTVELPSGDRSHLIGSPISLAAIGRVEGCVEARREGLRGWVWCPGDPDTDPCLSVGTGQGRRNFVAARPADDISGLPPLARPRSFVISWTDLPAGDAKIHLRGRDGRDLGGSPASGHHVKSSGVAGGKRRTRPADSHNAVGTAGYRSARGDWRDKATGAIILITHDDGGGVERRIQHAIASHEARGHRAIVLYPLRLPGGAGGVMATSTGLPAIRFELPRQHTSLLALLRATRPVRLELHHFLNHDPRIFHVIKALDVPYDVHIHDYIWFCPRIALVGRGDRYCGEPEPAECEICVARSGSYLLEDIRVSTLLKRSADILSGARRVIAPSQDAAARMARHFRGLTPIVVPHEDDDALDDPPPIPRVTGMVRVCVAGAIGLHKGFHVLLACARDARKRALDLTFVVTGSTIDDQRLHDTGRVFVTGPYQPEEAAGLIRAQNAALALFPSIWPETWSLGLTELWRAGLRVAAFDIGAPAERIRRTGRGFLLPLGLSAGRINDALINAAKGRSPLPIRRSSAYKPPIDATMS